MANVGYRLQLDFFGVTKFPIKYTSKSGATVSIEQSATYNTHGNGAYYFISRYFGGNTPINQANAIEACKSIYPAGGVAGYSYLKSMTVASNIYNSDCNCNCDCD